MAAKKQKTESWWASNADEGFIEIISHTNGRTICTVDVSDYESIEEAKQTAEIIASLPKLLTPSLVGHLIHLLHSDAKNIS